MMTTLSRGMMAWGLVAAVLSAPLTMAAAADDSAGSRTETIEETVSLDSGGSFSVKNKNGSITVDTWEKSEAKIVAEKKVRVNRGRNWISRFIGFKSSNISEDKLDQIMEDFHIEITGNEKNLEVTTIFPKVPSGVNLSMKYTIMLPKKVLASLDSTNGSLDISDVDGSVSLDSTNGRVYVRDITGPVLVDTTNGRIEISDVTGDTEVDSTNGSIHIDGLNGALSAETTNGSVRVKFAGNMAELGPINCRTTNGSITMDIPDEVDFDLEARTSHGGLHIDVPMDSFRSQSRKRVEGSVGSGGPLVKLRTTNGSIRVE